MPAPANFANSGPRDLESEKMALELEKVAIEKSKKRWSIVTGFGIPVVAGIIAIAHFWIDQNDEPLVRKAEFVKSLASKSDCDARRQFLDDYARMFPGDAYVSNFQQNPCTFTKTDGNKASH